MTALWRLFLENIAMRVIEYADRRVLDTRDVTDQIVARWHVR